jgi:hypothetical protein
VGVNINQIARALNSGDAPDSGLIVHWLERLDARLDDIALRLCRDPARRNDP